MGDVDFIVISRTQNREQLNELIDQLVQLEGVNRTSSTYVMDEIKSRDNVTATLSDDMIANIVGSAGDETVPDT